MNGIREGDKRALNRWEQCTLFVLCSQYVLKNYFLLAGFDPQWPNLKTAVAWFGTFAKIRTLQVTVERIAAMAGTKSWGGYFEESMQSVGLNTPKGYFDSAKTAGVTVAALIALFAKLPAGATMTELGIAGQAGAGAAAGSAAAAGAMATTIATVAAGVSAAFYIGACIGAVVYATQMKTVGEFQLGGANIQVLLNQAQRYKINVPQGAALKMIAEKLRPKSVSIA
jgi:hypothetical protein